MPMTKYSGLGKGDSPITGPARQIFFSLTRPVFRTLNPITSAEVGALFPSHDAPKGFRIGWRCKLIASAKSNVRFRKALLENW